MFSEYQSFVSLLQSEKFDSLVNQNSLIILGVSSRVIDLILKELVIRL